MERAIGPDGPLLRRRIDHNLNVLKSEFPHWANPQTGAWTTTRDGDWTGGAWPGMLWLAARRTGGAKYLDAARLWSGRLKPRARLQDGIQGLRFLLWRSTWRSPVRRQECHCART